MEKVSYKVLKSAVVVIDNSADESREYEISAKVAVEEDKVVGSIEDGVLRTIVEEGEGAILCKFSRGKWDGHTSYGYFADGISHWPIVKIIEEFVASMRAKVGESEIGEVFTAN